MMKFKALLFACCFGLISLASAENYYAHPKMRENEQKNNLKNDHSSHYCEIELINDTENYFEIGGYFDDGVPLFFSLYPFKSALINLYYDNHCHNALNVNISNLSTGVIYREFPIFVRERVYYLSEYLPQIKNTMK